MCLERNSCHENRFWRSELVYGQSFVNILDFYKIISILIIPIEN